MQVQSGHYTIYLHIVQSYILYHFSAAIERPNLEKCVGHVTKQHTKAVMGNSSFEDKTIKLMSKCHTSSSCKQLTEIT